MMSAEPIVVERLLNAAPARVWQALTDSRQMKNWYFDIAEFRPEPGFEFEFTAGNEDKTYVHRCRITEVIPGRKLAYTWSYQGYSGRSEVSFELFPEGEKTRLRLTHKGIDSFPAQDKDFSRESFTAGWTHIVGESLRKYVEENPRT